MLDLIDSKTKTLRKLMKLHLHIRKVSSITQERSSNHHSTPKQYYPNRESPLLTSICHTFSENISLTTSSQDLLAPRDSVNEVSEVAEQCINNDMDPQKETQATDEVITKIEMSESVPQEVVPSGTEQVLDPEEATEEVVEELIKGVVEATHELHQNYEKAVKETRKNPKETSGAPVEIQLPPVVTKEFIGELEMATTEPQHPNSPTNYAEEHSQFSSGSSLQSFSFLSNLEEVLSNLQGCRLGDYGFYLDSSTFMAIVDTLKATIANYSEVDGANKVKRNQTRFCMGRSSTQPVLNVNIDGIPRRKSNSNPECEKNMLRKRTRM
ncbi:hypothetical protein JTB14_002335 [Gonioctena quinquepunctata]|nr:hypothetical protein JTB14_002335 [Gonioctena quinquepunctata]